VGALPGGDPIVTGLPARRGEPRGEPRGEGRGEGRGERFVVRAAGATAALTAAGALCGLARDQTIARLFGADGDTDAFLVAWTVPEVAATLLIEDAMALVLVPAFTLALAGGRGPLRELLAVTFPRLLLVLALAAAALAAAAGPLVRALAPGLADPGLAVDCTRLTAASVLSFGVAGYFSAMLRAHRSFLPPAAIYIAYNLGIIAAALALANAWGVRAAAAGVALGGVLMVLLQLPFVLRRLPGPASARSAAPVALTSRGPVRRIFAGPRRLAPPTPRQRHIDRGAALSGPPKYSPRPLRAWGDPHAYEGDPPPERSEWGHPTGPQGPGGARHQTSRADPRRSAGQALVVVAPVALFALARQSQVLVERFLASSLPSGAISHLNYAQKVAQMPMVLSMMICTVTFPMVARALADGDTERARQRVHRDLVLAGAVVLTGAAYVVALAPQIIDILFQRGAFGGGATAATAEVMRVYALGLLGHTLVGTLVRPFFSTARPVWFPLGAMAGGLLVTVLAGVVAVRLLGWGAPGIAAANAVGISLAACCLLRGLRARMVPIDAGEVAALLGGLVLAAALAAATGWGAAALFGPAARSPLAACGLGALLVPAVFAATVAALRRPHRLINRQRARPQESESPA
jgi:putative peptidoglycan lipid II flippase